MKHRTNKVEVAQSQLIGSQAEATRASLVHARRTRGSLLGKVVWSAALFLATACSAAPPVNGGDGAGATDDPSGSTSGSDDSPSQSGGATAKDGGRGSSGADEGGGVIPSSGDPYADIFAGVDQTRLETLLRDMTGYDAITVNGQSVKITERYTPASKALWRAYFKQYYEALGATVQELDFPVKNLVGETTGHNMEAVFAGKSADSVVAIVHYDSTGATGKETQNPGVDDNMTPMAIQMETARLLAQRKGQLDRTVRFVATDYEEITTIEGGAAYVKYLQGIAQTQGFKIVAAIDGELSGWNCWAEGKCGMSNLPPAGSTLTVVSCTEDGKYNYPALSQQMIDTATKYSSMKVETECDSDTDGSELYNFWKAGIPAFYFEEFGNDGNTYYDEGGQDTIDRIDLGYFFHIGQIAAVFIAKVVGVTP